MSHAHTILLPSKLKTISEDAVQGVYEIDGLYPGYGHTLGNSLRRIILSSLPGAAITQIKVNGASHEFSALDGVKEDMITIILNLKRVRFELLTDEPQVITLSAKEGPVTAKAFALNGQVNLLTPDQYLCEVTGKQGFTLEVTIEKGLGFIPREHLRKEKVDIGVISVDAVFTPIRKVSYEVENMRVGDRTDHNRLRVMIETDGTLTPRAALEQSIHIMINQLRTILDLSLEPKESIVSESASSTRESSAEESTQDMSDILKTRIDTLDFSTRTMNALSEANIRTLGGLIQKTSEHLLGLEGFGQKSLEEVQEVLTQKGLTLKQ